MRPLTEQDYEAREAVLDRLATAFEKFATKEQEHRSNGDPVKAEGAHRYAQWVLRAYQAEAEPEHAHVLPIPGCRRCES